MLAQKVHVNIFGELSDDVYTGYITVEKNTTKKVYVLSKAPVRDYFKGVVVAIACFNDSEERLIIACENEVYYEPDIRISFSRLRNAEITSIKKK